MAFYNCTKRDSRQELRRDREAELAAVKTGQWPRDIADLMRWNAPRSYTAAEWAAKMCQSELDYLDGLEQRIAAGDPHLAAYER
jgi:hypothetical protein